MNGRIDLTVELCYKDNKHELKLKLCNTKLGLKRIIIDHDFCRPGLLLAGFTQTFAEKKFRFWDKLKYRISSNLTKMSKR